MMSSQRFSTNQVSSSVVRACAVLGARFGSCEDGPPNLLYIIFAVLLLVVERWQFRVAYTSASTRIEKLWFMFFCGFGCFEVLDFFTDGLPRLVGEELRSSLLTCGLRRRSPVHVEDICGLPGPRSGRARVPPFVFPTVTLSYYRASSSPVVYVVGALYMWRIFAVCQVLAVGAQGFLLLSSRP